MARTLPELIRACFGMEETPRRRVRDWLDRLDPGEKLRREKFATQFKPMYRASRTCRSATDGASSCIELGAAGVEVVIMGRFGVSLPQTETQERTVRRFRRTPIDRSRCQPLCVSLPLGRDGLIFTSMVVLSTTRLWPTWSKSAT